VTKHRTAQGKALDMDALILKNEKTRAVGNMNVNARGDEIDSKGKIVRTRDEIMKEHYKVNEKQNQQEELEPDADDDEPVVVEKENTDASE